MTTGTSKEDNDSEKGIRTWQRGRGMNRRTRKVADAPAEISTLIKEAKEEKAKNLRGMEWVFAEIAAENLKSLRKQEKQNVESLYRKFAARMARLPDRSLLCKKYWRNHEFLSQQIDERSHQMFTMSSLFVPVSFLFFMYTVINRITDLTSYILMTASLVFVLSWFLFYRRVQLLNEKSYPHIFAYELVLGLSCHLTLKQPYEKSRLMRWTRHIFRANVFFVGFLWTAYLLHIVEAIFTDFSTNLLYNVGIVILCLIPFAICVIPWFTVLIAKLKDKATGS
ncbi:MAG: hypothetical protein WED04_09190 [Promethearchaeati archaeon SRVP18_Atabeyarchaeia-1]